MNLALCGQRRKEASTGSWRSLLERFGPWRTVAGCVHCWRQAGVWEQVRQILVAPGRPVLLLGVTVGIRGWV